MTSKPTTFPTVTSGDILGVVEEIDQEDMTVMRQITGSRMKIMFCDDPVALISHCVEYRFLELKMLAYQWRVQSIRIPMITDEVRQNFRLAHRVLSQFRAMLCLTTNYFKCISRDYERLTRRNKNNPKPSKCCFPTGNNKNVLQTVDVSDQGDQELANMVVEMAADIFIIIDVYDKRICVEEGDICHSIDKIQCDKVYALSQLAEWESKLAFFMRVIMKTFTYHNRLALLVDADDSPGRNVEQFERIHLLRSVRFEEQETIQQKMKKICMEAKAERQSNTAEFDAENWERFLSNGWKSAFDVRHTMILDLEGCKEYKKVSRNKIKKHRRR